VTAGAPFDWAAAGRAPDPCLICGGLAHDELYPQSYAGSVAEASTYFLANRLATARGRIVRCRDCEFVFTSPRFSDADYDVIYRAVPMVEDLDPSFQAAKDARFRRLAGIVRKLQPSPKAFLDFGCGDGGFLQQFDDPAGRGFEVGGGERRTAGPCEIVTGDWASLAGTSTFPAESFDFVAAFDVLEHLPRIDEDLALIRSVLKPGGVFFASVPNIASLVAKAMGKQWNMLLLEHLWYFSPQTFERFLARHGFQQLFTRPIPFDAPVAHVATRLAQTFGMTGVFKAGPISRIVLPTPAGIMLGAFRKTD
jgi:SAM-dependent methyltransferase